MSDSAIAVIILAAGGSRRLKQPKQLVPYFGTTLLRHAAMTALESGVGPVLVVLGAEAERCRAELEGMRLTSLVHALWGEGLGSSIREGVQAARRAHPDLEAVVLMTCDQPGVDARALRALVTAFRTQGAKVVACAYAGTTGIPALFAKSELDGLERIVGDRGAKSLIGSRPSVATIVCEGAALDVDVAEDLERLTNDEMKAARLSDPDVGGEG